MHSSSAGIAAAATLGAALYTGLVVLVLWSYLACFLTQPGHVPPSWHPFQDAEASDGACAWFACLLSGSGAALMQSQDGCSGSDCVA